MTIRVTIDFLTPRCFFVLPNGFTDLTSSVFPFFLEDAITIDHSEQFAADIRLKLAFE